MIARLVALVSAVVGLLAGLLFVAALSDYRNLRCWEMPANQCSDAARTMLMMGMALGIAASTSLWLWRRRRTHA